MPWQLLPAARLSDHAGAWDALQRACSNTPFLETAFLLPLLQEFGDGTELLALHHGRDGLDAATLLRRSGRASWDTFQPSQLPLGPWLAQPVAEGDTPLDERIDSLIRALPGLTLSLGLTQLDPKLNPRPPEHARLRLLDYISTSAIDIEGGFDAYWDARGKNLRQNTRKQFNKLKTDAIEPRLECLTDPADVAAALQDYGQLESAGWKAGTGTAIHPDNAQGRFYQRMLQNFCAQDRGRIYRYRFGEQVVSMDLCIDNGPLVVILKTAYDESYRTISPSTLMRHDEFKAWWDEGRYQRIEFYGKTMEWHSRWTEQERVLHHATAYRWAWVRSLHDQLRARRALNAAPTEPVDATPPPATVIKA